MKAIEIIGQLRERYSNKYTKTPNYNKDHYINWLQDEYAKLVMKQANGLEHSSDKCHIQNVNGWPLEDFPDNLPLYLDSGLFQLRSDDMEQVLLQQGVNESNIQFLERCKAYR
ncbi:MAG TPA: hypothetical protein DHV48_03565 [Prolixibacteraceae bacterium]|nr:hypothetical protein [Prolixibacteraceae bacterium]